MKSKFYSVYVSLKNQSNWKFLSILETTDEWHYNHIIDNSGLLL